MILCADEVSRNFQNGIRVPGVQDAFKICFRLHQKRLKKSGSFTVSCTARRDLSVRPFQPLTFENLERRKSFLDFVRNAQDVPHDAGCLAFAKELVLHLFAPNVR